MDRSEGVIPEPKSGDLHSSHVDKLASLRSYRRARGLCDRCTEKWSCGHKCASSVQLHALEEVLELVSSDSEPDAKESNEPQLMSAICQAAWNGTDGHHILKLQGSIQSMPLLILVDSGSSHTFRSTRFLLLLQGISLIPSPLSIKVANGELLSCQHQLLNTKWYIQDYSFVSNIHLLPLVTYDLVVAMDWLEALSHMKVDWASKWMAIPYKGNTIFLHGLPAAVPVGTTVEVLLLVYMD